MVYVVVLDSTGEYAHGDLCVDDPLEICRMTTVLRYRLLRSLGAERGCTQGDPVTYGDGSCMWCGKLARNHSNPVIPR